MGLVIPFRSLIVVRIDGIEVARTENFLTEFGEAYIADRLSDRSEANGDIDFMAVGTGSGAIRSSTALAGTERARVAATVAQGTGADDNDLTYTSTFGVSVPASDYTLTEGGLFTASSGSNMVNYFEFSPGILKTTAMTLQITVTWTIGAS